MTLEIFTTSVFLFHNQHNLVSFQAMNGPQFVTVLLLVFFTIEVFSIQKRYDQYKVYYEKTWPASCLALLNVETFKYLS